MSIKIDQKTVSVEIDKVSKSVTKSPNNQSVDVVNNSFNIDCDTLEVSATPIIFNQIVTVESTDLIWLITNTNTAVILNRGYIAINDFSNINFSFGGVPTNGQSVAFFNMGQGGFRLLLEGLIFGDKVTLANGYLESLTYGDYILIRYLNNQWVVQQSIGNINLL